jgi:hypothetical protein
MPTEHKKFHHRVAHHLKRKVYPDRYFAWAIASLVIAGSALVSYVLIMGNALSTDAVFTTAAQPNKIYINSAEGYSVSYPNTWVLEPSDSDSQVVFENPADNRETISVTPLRSGDENSIRTELQLHTERDFINSGGSGVQLFINVNPASPTQPLPDGFAFVSRDGKSFYVNGWSPYFGAFVQNFKITP